VALGNFERHSEVCDPGGDQDLQPGCVSARSRTASFIAEIAVGRSANADSQGIQPVPNRASLRVTAVLTVPC